MEGFERPRDEAGGTTMHCSTTAAGAEGEWTVGYQQRDQKVTLNHLHIVESQNVYLS